MLGRRRADLEAGCRSIEATRFGSASGVRATGRYERRGKATHEKQLGKEHDDQPEDGEGDAQSARGHRVGESEGRRRGDRGGARHGYEWLLKGGCEVVCSDGGGEILKFKLKDKSWILSK